jgi:hypothetical protein
MSPNVFAHIAFISGGIIPIVILRWLFKRFIFNENIETFLRKSLLYVLVFVVTVVLGSMGVGEGSFVQRLENIPSINVVFSYGVGTLIVMGFDLFISARIGK